MQVWISPDQRGHTPQYGSSKFTKEDRHNVLRHILGGSAKPPKWTADQAPTASVKLHQDCNVFVSESDAGKEFDISLGQGRQAYMLCMEGSLKVNDVELLQRDAAEAVAGEKVLPMKLSAGPKGSHFMIIEMQGELEQSSGLNSNMM
jgi:redox-sensitive bicupin YhaK (pirin superfamily)